jgi:hypothetical protein
MVRLFWEHTGVAIFDPTTHRAWLNRDHTQAWAFVEVHSATDGEALIDRAHHVVVNRLPWEVAWTYGSLPAILAMLDPVTNPAYPQLSFYYHIDFGLMRVLNHHDNTEVPRAEWPSAAPNDDAFAAADAEPSDVVAPPLTPPPTPPLSPSSSLSPPPATLAPVPTPSHLLTAAALDTFVAEHPDFRASPLQLVTLDDPYVLATTQPDPQTIIDDVLPQAGLVEEGSIWDLAESPLPTAATWTTQLNLAHTPDIQGWIDRYPLDPWRGTLTIVLHSTAAHFRNIPHRAYLPLQQGQVVTLLSRPFWNWTDRRLLAGTYVVACSPYTPPGPPPHLLPSSTRPRAPLLPHPLHQL